MRTHTGKGIGGHTLQGNGLYDTWLTPPGILMALGVFNLDPCAALSPRPFETAEHYIELPEDGLKANWHGRVWLNPPYGTKLCDWMQRMSQHNKGTALTFARTETEAWQRFVWPFTTAVLFIAGRLNFHLPDGTRTSYNVGGPSALIAYGEKDAEILCESGIRGALVKVFRGRTPNLER